jgi:hypothetical protein
VIDVCAQLSTLNLGIFLAYWIDYAFTQSSVSSYAWRIPCILQCIFLLPMLVILTLVPESPRWLASHSQNPDDSLVVLQRLHNYHRTPEEISSLHISIVQTCEFEKSLGAGSWKDRSSLPFLSPLPYPYPYPYPLPTSHPLKLNTVITSDKIHSRRRFLLACLLQSFQQLGGINALIYYSNTLFSSLHFSPHLSALMSGFLQTWFFLASFIPWLLIDRIGRRPLLLSMIAVMACVMIVQTGLIYNVQNNTPIAPACGRAAAAMLFLFEGAFTVGFQATVWVYPSEVLPLRLRQRGSSVSTACNWIFNFMVVQITPVAISAVGYKFYIVFAVLNTAWLPVIYLFFPETRGLELEDVDGLFMDEGNWERAGMCWMKKGGSSILERDNESREQEIEDQSGEKLAI